MLLRRFQNHKTNPDYFQDDWTWPRATPEYFEDNKLYQSYFQMSKMKLQNISKIKDYKQESFRQQRHEIVSKTG
jgi:hypothetical protein